MTNKPILYLSVALSVLVALAVGATAIFITTDSMQASAARDEFPAEQLRTAKVPPQFELANQHGEPVSLDALRGKVVMLTAVFATCHTACPTIIAEAKSAVNKLTPEQREDLAIVAITLDPKNDTEAKRKSAAEAHDLQPPLFHYVNGDDPDEVLNLVEQLGWARSVDAETGEIGHSNMFVLVDRSGKIAYTLTLDGGDRDWLGAALGELLAEKDR